MDFNKKIVTKILSDLEKAKKLDLSFTILENNIHQNLGAVDSTFPNEIKKIIDEILNKISDHREEQYCASLNTPREDTYDEMLPVGDLFDIEIDCLKKYILFVPETKF